MFLPLKEAEDAVTLAKKEAKLAEVQNNNTDYIIRSPRSRGDHFKRGATLGPPKFNQNELILVKMSQKK